MEGSIMSRISAVKAEATKSQKLLINYLSGASFSDVIYLSITELAEHTGASEATILRFCRLLGFKGYQDFKLCMAKELTLSEQKNDSFISAICDNLTASLELAKSRLTRESVERAAEIILSAKRVTVYGIGHSRLAAEELHNRLAKMGIWSVTETDTHLESILVSNMDESDAAVFFSVSGGTLDLIEIAEAAKAGGCRVVVVTSYERSPLGRLGDVAVIAASRESPVSGGSMQAKVVQLYAADAICSAIYATDPQRFKAATERASAAVSGRLV